MKRKPLPSLKPACAIAIGAPARLRALRAYVDAWNKNKAEGAGYITTLADWKAARKHCAGIAARYPDTAGRWGDAGRFAYQRHFYSQKFPFEVVGDATDRNRELNGSRDATGYYCDSFQNGLAIPVVLKYRRKVKHRDRDDRTNVLYCPAVRFTECEGVTSYPLDVYYDAGDAMRAAHGYAERAAEECREDDAKQRAEDDIYQARESIREARENVAALVADIRAAGALPAAICKVTRAALRMERTALHVALRTVKERRADYWSAVEN